MPEEIFFYHTSFMLFDDRRLEKQLKYAGNIFVR